MKPETRQELLRTKSVLSWTPENHEPPAPHRYVGPTFSYEGKKYTNLIVNEKHYSVAEIAAMWGISTDLARDTFCDEPGVLTFERPRTRVKRGYSLLRIPESVLVRVHTRLVNNGRLAPSSR
jgi:hypothetical protein